MAELKFEIVGEPAPQGSKKAYVRNGRAILVESSAKVAPWRTAVTIMAHNAALKAGWTKVDEAVSVTVTFWMPRPASVKRLVPDRKPDIDKLCRSLLDGLSDAGIWSDDARVIELIARKSYADNHPLGATVEIRTY